MKERRFDGEYFIPWCLAYTRALAGEKAEAVRRDGYLARVVPYSGGWRIFRGPKRRKP